MTMAKKGIAGWFINAFPAPKYITMPAVALDISPNSIKYLDGTYTATGCLPGAFREVFLPEGTIVNGVVQDHDAFVAALSELQKKGGHTFAFAAIPESALYLYTLRLKGHLSDAAIMQQVEFSFEEHVPLPLSEAVYDFDRVGQLQGGVMVSVTAAPKDVISGYQKAFRESGFIVRAVELEAHAVARSVSRKGSQGGISMIVDIGYSRAGIIITKNSLPIFSITISGGSKEVDTVIAECKKQYTFWDTRTNSKGKRIERITSVQVTGGTSGEFVDLLSNALGKEVQLAQIWGNLFGIDEYIPAINAEDSQAMATLAGLLLKNKE